MSVPEYPDLLAAREAIAAGEVTAATLLDVSLANARAGQCARAFLRLDAAIAAAAADHADRLHAAGGPLPPLGGLAVSIKDLFDVAGQVTTAASTVLADRPPAPADSVAVARLRQAGAALIGRTNMTEFAFSAVGINPHYGTPANAGTRGDPEARIPGGSTSGGAVSVAAGAAWAGLGSDTGGSIRIPAALQGLVGFKPTARLTPCDGTIPLSPTLDTVGAITRSVRDARLLHEILAARRTPPTRRPLAAWRLAAVSTIVLEDLDATVAAAFDRTLATLRRRGAQIEELAVPEFAELATINAAGGFSAAESWAWHRPLLARQESRYDPRVVVRVRRGEAMSAADYLDLLRERADWQRRVLARIGRFDALLGPTVPMVAPPLREIVTDERFFVINARLLRNPSIVNFLDGCALSLPCHAAGELPVGLSVWHGPLCDDAVLDVSAAIEAELAASR